MNAYDTIISSFVTIAVAVIFYLLLRKKGFKIKGFKIKTGPIETQLERDDRKQGDSSGRQTHVSQEATEGGTIINSEIALPADSGAAARQSAKDKGSSISGSTIKLN